MQDNNDTTNKNIEHMQENDQTTNKNIEHLQDNNDTTKRNIENYPGNKMTQQKGRTYAGKTSGKSMKTLDFCRKTSHPLCF